MLLLAANLFFATPSPLEMPRAQAHLVREGGAIRLEDRYDAGDLWLSRAVDGVWIDEDGRRFVSASLATEAPPGLFRDAGAPALTRRDYVGSAKAIPLGDEGGPKRRLAVCALHFCAVGLAGPVPPADRSGKPRQRIRGLKEVLYCNGTNTAFISCAYLPEKAASWRYASLTLAPGDDYDDALALFEDEFLAKPEVRAKAELAAPAPEAESERELLRADARHSVAAYGGWHVTDSDAFTVLDDLAARDFVVTLTNDLTALRAECARVLPSPLDGSDALAVARIFADRGEYLDALKRNDREGLDWSAAYWSPQRRELVAYLPPDGAEKLLETIRHEAFHQYFSYATAMIAPSPWINEGYAQYFEKGPDGPSFVDPCDLPDSAELLPSLLSMDYGEFYAGTDAERRLRYRLALTVAYFLEKGAPKVRFQPFRDVKGDYVRALLETKDMHKATAAAFKDEDTLRLFIAEWRRFWEGM